MNSKIVYIKLSKLLSNVTECPQFEALELIRHFCKMQKEQVLLKKGEISDVEYQILLHAVSCRISGYPLQYLIGEWDFYGRTFSVGEGVLIPRADTEILVEIAIEWAKDKNNLSIADLCSGSGCIAITLAKELSVQKIFAVENSSDALKYLNKNIQLHQAKVTVIADDVLSPSYDIGTVDMIVSNPPYLSKSDMKSLQKEVSAEPQNALFGGEDGILFYRKMIPIWKSHLNSGGAIFFEIGFGQAEDVKKILIENKFTEVCTYKDLCGIIRVVCGIQK